MRFYLLEKYLFEKKNMCKNPEFMRLIKETGNRNIEFSIFILILLDILAFFNF
jgi:hypothetical protein